MADAYIFDGLRTGRAKASTKGAFYNTSALSLGLTVLEGLKGRGIPCGDADDLIVGCATQVDEQGANPARTMALLAGLEALPGLTINRFCASGLDAIAWAASRVRGGDANFVLAGGVESVSRVPMFSDRGALYHDPTIAQRLGTVHMGIAADLAATQDGRTREALDAYALRTRDKARKAVPRARAQIAPVTDGAGQTVLDRDELLDFAPDAATLAALPAAFETMGHEGQDRIVQTRYPDLPAIAHLHTRGSSPAMADGAALVSLGTMSFAEQHGLLPRARVVGSLSVSADPVAMLTAGQTAAQRLLERHGLRPADIDVVGFAEAFAALCLRFMSDLALDHDRFNPDGGTIAMGHAFGATGAILTLDVSRQLVERSARYGLVVVSGAAGLGTALLLERVRGT